MITFIIISILVMIISSRISEWVEQKLNEKSAIENREEEVLDTETLNILKNYGLIKK